MLPTLLDSIAATSSLVDVVVYLDDDLSLTKDIAATVIHRGPRIGSVASMNLLAKLYFNDHSVVGMLPDDSTMTVDGWDRHLLDLAEEHPICMFDIPNSGDPENGGLWWVDTPFVTARFYRAMGWFAPPRFKHWCWPIVLGSVARATAYFRPRANKVNVQHNRLPPIATVSEQSDREGVFSFLLEDFPGAISRLNDALVQSTK
jgi:hypothetical protein